MATFEKRETRKKKKKESSFNCGFVGSLFLFKLYIFLENTWAESHLPRATAALQAWGRAA